MKSITSIYLMILFLFIACEQNGITPLSDDDPIKPSGLMKISLNMADAPSEVVRLEGVLYNNEGDEIYFDFEIDEYSATATVEDIPSGVWILRVDAYDEDDNLVYTGKTEITVYPGVVTPISLHLNPATGSLQITVTWGDGDGDDQFEDNDKQSEAAPLYEYTFYNNLYVSTHDDDWYAMSISADSLSISCEFTHSNGDINIDLVDGTGRILASSQGKTDNEKINHIVGQLDTYYIHVYLSSGKNNTYTIWWDDIWAGSR